MDWHPDVGRAILRPEAVGGICSCLLTAFLFFLLKYVFLYLAVHVVSLIFTVACGIFSCSVWDLTRDGTRAPALQVWSLWLLGHQGQHFFTGGHTTPISTLSSLCLPFCLYQVSLCLSLNGNMGVNLGSN